jgi:hypothetical protein
VIAVRAATVPRWLGWLSVVAGLSMLVSFIGVPQIVWGIWVLVVSLGLFRGERVAGVAASRAREVTRPMETAAS